ncbi:hypothetical protein H8B02_30520 [Bradyrhizobium sp. Pear77]|uniref:hypothetical protein n=1 Tax=Bradyrhizobium TaxID=374 RepID=UPI001E36FAC5|nr:MULTISPECIES: hypothetical protein [Bradyrhizobium]MCC8957611.1 hypothetical protein [Bradyrhizobium altum]MCC8968585.1 hypothetical protein [Bradyrhizobium oropedii]
MKNIVCAIAVLVNSSASAQEMAPIFHNGSRGIITRDKGIVEIRYETPRSGLPVKEGTVLFSGRWDEHGNYEGVAYTFKRGCDPAPYRVTGKDAGPGIILTGIPPRRDPHGCAVIGTNATVKHSRLVFEYEIEDHN